MAKAFDLRKQLKLHDKRLLRQLFADQHEMESVDWGVLRKHDIEPIAAAWEAMLEAGRRHFQVILLDVDELSDPRGQKVLIEELEWLSPEKLPAFQACASPADKALWAYLEARSAFDAAAIFARAEAMRGGNYSNRWIGLPRDSITVTEAMAGHGLRSLAFPIRGFEKHTNAVDARPIVRVAACMSLAGLAVGNDSALINWTPIVDLPALCLLGPTRKEIFDHAPLIRCLTPRTPLPYNATPDHPAGGDCNGCCYHFKHNPFCSQTCMSLANMLPAEVAEEAVKYHREVWG